DCRCTAEKTADPAHNLDLLIPPSPLPSPLRERGLERDWFALVSLGGAMTAVALLHALRSISAPCLLSPVFKMIPVAEAPVPSPSVLRVKGFPVFTKGFIILGFCNVVAADKKVEINCQPVAVLALHGLA